MDGGLTIRIAAAGDISDNSLGQQQGTSDLIVDAGYTAVLILGDNQYPNGGLADYNTYFDPTWGRFRSKIRPVPGNHEYQTANAAGYFTYFGADAGDPTKGYYSYDLGDWHFIALNSNSSCGDIACNAGSAQVTWLKADLAANTKKCVLAYWHHPRFSSGLTHGNNSGMATFWNELYDAGVELVLNGHEHNYERFNAQTPAQVANPDGGIVEFVVGTGGVGSYLFSTAQPNSAVRQNGIYGVLELTLSPGGYAWRFVRSSGSAFTDTGSGVCH